MMTLAGVVVAGYLFGLVPLVWMLRDLARFHPHLWTGYGRPHPWHQAAWLSYAVAGWPVFVVAATWRASEPRGRMERVRRREVKRRVGEAQDA
jgi:hypothetical protein